MFLKKYIRKSWPLWLSFLIPTLIMTVYFAYRNMAPFGSGSILTVDLGQQYVDFLAYFKHAVTSDPNSFVYSFSKAFGGEMIGVWAYYLMSPLNLILLFFPIKSLPAGILLITVLKYGLSGLSFGYLIKQSFKLNQWLIPSLATIYAMNGWIIANQLNIIWLDCMVMLPLIVLGMNRIIQNGRIKTYVISLSVMLIINYYMAYMICLFAVLYFLANLINHHQNWRSTITRTVKWTFASLLSGGLAAFLLLPTFAALKDSKGVYTVTSFKWKFEYPPFNFLAKFFNGSFNFDQMPNGTPNIFVGSIVIVAFLMFFFNPTFKMKQRITTAIVTAILVLSMMLQPLDLLWHAMQFPIWYPYRFSFIFCFWMVWIAAQNLASNPVKNISWPRKEIVITMISAITFIIILSQKKFTFLNSTNIIIGAIILVLAMGLLMFFPPKSPYVIASIVVLSVGEMGLNAFNSLNNISYVTNENYVNYTLNLRKAVQRVNDQDHGFFRLGKTFYRTKDDPFEANYNGGEHFSSTFEANTPDFMDDIGQPDGDGFIEYSNGTLVSDALLGFKYFLHQNNPKPQQYLQALTDKPDLNDYQLINEENNVQTYQNPYTLPIAFQGSQNIFKTAFSDDPMHYQSNLFNQLAGQPINNKLFSAANFSSSSFINTENQNTITGSMFRRKNLDKPAHVVLHFTPQNNNAYYLTIGNNITNKNALIKVNGQILNQYNVYRNTVVANVASRMKNQPITIDIELLKGSLWMQNLTLYQLNNSSFIQTDQKLQSNPLEINSHTSNSFNGHIKINQRNAALVTTIPYEKGWHIIANGKPVKIQQWANMFIGAKLKPGNYRIRIYYWPPLLNVGLLISFISLLICSSSLLIAKRKNK